MLDEVDETVASCLRSDEAASPVQTLSGQHTDELVLQLLVGAEQETDLARTGSNVTG